jgi:hypothetical protein
VPALGLVMPGWSDSSPQMTMFQDPLYVAIASRRFDRLSGLALLSVPVELDMIKEVLTTRGISATHEVIRQ